MNTASKLEETNKENKMKKDRETKRNCELLN
jgi:hypothetical protein